MAIQLLEPLPRPLAPDAGVTLSEAYEADGRLRDALAITDTVLRGGYETARNYCAKARLERALGRRDAARKSLRTGLAHYPEDAALRSLEASFDAEEKHKDD